MVISVLHFVLDLPDIASIKEKRQIVQSVKHRLQNKFKISVAEVALQDSWRFAEIGAAVVSNSKQYGESVLHKALQFAENFALLRSRGTSLFLEIY